MLLQLRLLRHRQLVLWIRLPDRVRILRFDESDLRRWHLLAVHRHPPDRGGPPLRFESRLQVTIHCSPCIPTTADVAPQLQMPLRNVLQLVWLLQEGRRSLRQRLPDGIRRLLRHPGQLHRRLRLAAVAASKQSSYQ